MKRKILELRQVLLAAESKRDLSYNAEDEPSLAYHARLLEEMKCLSTIDVETEIYVKSLTNHGHDLLDLLRDEDVLRSAQLKVAKQGMDPDNLSLVTVIIGRMQAAAIAVAGKSDA